MRRLVSESVADGFAISLIFLGVLILHAPNVSAQVCEVPTLAYPSIQAALDDVTCTEVVLAAQTFAETVTVSRSLVLDGASSAATVIVGLVTVTGASTEATLQGLKVEGGGCFPVALDVGDGAQVTSGPDVAITNADGGECPIFIDGFELGAAATWSSTVP